MPNTDRDSMLERWADGMERLEQYYEGIYGPPPTPAQLPPITTRDAMLEAIADGMERAKRNINKKSPTYHNTDSAYVKTVPAGDVHYASLEQIGGKTLVWNQLVNPANISASKTENGITFTNNGDGSVTVSGTATGGNAALMILSARTWQAHHYCLRGCPSGGSSTTYNLRLYGAGSNVYDTGDGAIWYHATALYKQCEIVIMEGTVISTPITFRPTFVDLTLAYGSGNEPTTVAEFQQMFPASYYSYNAGTLMSAGVTEVKSVGKNLFDSVVFEQGTFNITTGAFSSSTTRLINRAFVDVLPNTIYNVSIGTSSPQIEAYSLVEYKADETYIGYSAINSANTTITTGVTTGKIRVSFRYLDNSTIVDTDLKNPLLVKPIATYPIPAEVQALEGYGWSAGTAYNYIDYERKVFVKCVDRVVLDGTQDIKTYNWRADTNGVGWIYQYNVTNHALPPNNSTLGNIVSDRLMSQTYGDLYTHNVGIALNPSADYGIFIWQSDTSLTTVSAINTYMSNNPITVYYELATPQEIDISAYLTDDNLISVESGGTLTFPNSNGDDYRIEVPSSVTFVVGEP